MNILLTSAGRRSYMIDYFKVALNGSGCVHASNSVLTHTLLIADKYVITPNIYDESYISFLIEYCIKNDIKIVISLFDIDLPILAKNKELFSKHGINVIVSDYRVTQICNDKWETYNFLKKIGLKQPSTYISLQEAKGAINNGNITFPLILKPRWGMGSIGIYIAENELELQVFYDKLTREIFNTYLKYESAENKEECVLIQEKISGQEYGIEIFNDLDGNYVTTLAKKKIAMRAGETDMAEVIDPKDFESIGVLISSHLKHIANLDVDVFVTNDGETIVLEMNCRFGGQYPFSHLAGANFPKQIIEWCEGLPTDEKNLHTSNIIACKEITPVVFKPL